MAAVNLLYQVGSRNEQKGFSGLAHFMEHLMFTGSKNAASFDTPLQQAGGECNAWTSADFTNYYEVLPSQNVETALWLERDRLLDLELSEESIEIQRSVVIEEFKQRCINAPYGDIFHLMHELAYKVHPYRWPTIGHKVEDIAAIDRDRIVDFRNTHYSVNNLVMCISGNVTFDDAVKLVDKWFGDIQPRQSQIAAIPAEPVQDEPRQMTVYRDVPADMLVKAYRMCGRTDDDFVACDMISDILSNGMSSRFVSNILRKHNVFTDLDASVGGTYDPGLFIIRGRLVDGTAMEEAEQLIEKELQRLMCGDIEQIEMEKCANKYASTTLFENLLYSQKAMRLCICEALGDADKVNTEQELYRHETVKHLSKVATELFKATNCSTIWYKKQ